MADIDASAVLSSWEASATKRSWRSHASAETRACAALVAVCREKIPRRPRALRTLVPHVSIGRAALVSYLGAPLPNVVIGPFGSGWTVQGVSVGYAVLVCLYLTVTPAATVRRA